MRKNNLKGENNMNDFDIERLTKMEDRGKSNSKRIDDLEKIADAIHEQNKNIAELVIEIRHTNEMVKSHDARLSKIEDKPSRWLTELMKIVATTVIGGVIGIIIGMIKAGAM